jgi:hypothetical protein
MIDWVTVATLATAIGTLVLAFATYGSVRAANRSAAVSERALLTDNRPLLINSHMYDPTDKIRFRENRWVKVAGGHAYVNATKDVIYFVISLRNAGRGLAVLDQWSVLIGVTSANEPPNRSTHYRRLTRDLYIPASDIGLWQGAIREKDDPQFKKAAKAIKNQETLLIDIEYSDQDGGQRTVSRFALSYHEEGDWLTSAVRHWRIDGTNPRGAA